MNELVRRLHIADAVVHAEERRRVERRLIAVEKERVLRAIHDGLASVDTAAELASLDARFMQLEDHRDS